ncbi:7017_t:CDS:2 [Ambispora leptoticha]|uniref:7017_t:CDS:1 n=1 Tax=Ambispora leptoticha TaxID=144679 RepID=A0A9N8Z948_9GLOM|nr:7017_t:CDS:2 [Ambispora leptoticha]
MSNVEFSYQARRNVRILRGLDAEMFAEKNVALRTNIKDWNLEYLRSNMALVGQEPVLFDATVGENIAYGKGDVHKKRLLNRQNELIFIISL